MEGLKVTGDGTVVARAVDGGVVGMDLKLRLFHDISKSWSIPAHIPFEIL